MLTTRTSDNTGELTWDNSGEPITEHHTQSILLQAITSTNLGEMVAQSEQHKHLQSSNPGKVIHTHVATSMSPSSMLYYYGWEGNCRPHRK